MILGLLYKAKKKRALAVQHLIEAKRILSQFGQTPILARVEGRSRNWGNKCSLRKVRTECCSMRYDAAERTL